MEYSDFTNVFSKTLVVIFEEECSAPYFLRPGESLPKSWAEGYTIKSINVEG